MSKVKAHSGMSRFPRAPLVAKPCTKCGSTFHTLHPSGSISLSKKGQPSEHRDRQGGAHVASAAQGRQEDAAASDRQPEVSRRRAPANYSTLARHVPVNPRREEPRRVDRATGRTDEPTPEEREYMRRVREEMPCSALGQAGHAQCDGPHVAHHAGRHGYGFKSSHYETICLCDRAHKDLHDNPGNGWTRAAGLDGAGVRAFEDFWIQRTQRELGHEPSRSNSLPF